jgi:TATA-binding protein-associated factor
MGFEDGSEGSGRHDYTNNTNKILLFSRYNETLDVINKLFINKLFPSLKYLRIDGTIPAAKRFELVKKFNQDNNIKLLLLTTSVGGVGLNLHTANVVVMFDHDYNPMNDLQAIDRAHRIGQKNILNVYRLIMKDTLEEQIMG